VLFVFRTPHNQVHCEVAIHEFGSRFTRFTASSEINFGFFNCVYLNAYNQIYGSGSSVGTVTELRAGRTGIESRWGRDFPPVQTGPGAHSASCKMGTGSFPGIKCGRGVLLTTHRLLVPRSWKSRAIPLPTFWATPGL